MATPQQLTPDTLISVKISLDGATSRRFKLPLKDLTPVTLPSKLRQALAVPADQEIVFERYSDSAGAYVTLDPNNQQVYKSLFRAAKAKLKLRLRATLPPKASEATEAPVAGASTTTVAAATASTDMPVIARTPVSPLETQGTASSSSNNDKPKSPSVAAPEPLSRQSASREDFFAKLASMSRERELALRMKEPPAPVPYTSWSVYCNHCDKPMENEHYHCSVCDNGDYDLCEACVTSGVHCPGEGHWLIKRFVSKGKVINSMTRTIPPKVKVEEMPGAFTEEKQSAAMPRPMNQDDAKAFFAIDVPSRTCNNCVAAYAEGNFVTCTDCPDFDLCLPCHVKNQHGHHPGHKFEPVADASSPLVQALCRENRGLRHNAICDGCDQVICGVRHKCLNCPDWDYCSTCMKSSKLIHPAHRFVPVYERLPEPRAVSVKHFGIFCDGPLCHGKRRSYIEGVRYKCAVCNDTDFCANCEADPNNRHNRTHPLIKFKTPVRNVSVTTMNEDKHGSPLATMGDKPSRRSTSTETTPVASSSNVPSQVKTVFDVKPTTDAPRKSSKVEIKDLLSEPIEEKVKVENVLSPSTEKTAIQTDVPQNQPAKEIPASQLNAHFLHDIVPDGTKMTPSQSFAQSWTLRNPGPHPWPVGCSVRFVGGDDMLSLDQRSFTSASESNVTDREIQPNEEYSFRISMKAPPRTGEAISYWRLKTPSGAPFGHRLWCHVGVVQSHLRSPPTSPVDARTTLNHTSMRLQDLPSTHVELPNWSQLRPHQAEQLRRFNAMPPAQRFEAYKNYIEDQRKAYSTASTASPAPAPVSSSSTSAPSEEPSNTLASPVAQPAVAEESEKEASVSRSDSSQSQMIFPTLEKESPVTSVHEAEASTQPRTVNDAPFKQEMVASPLPSTVAPSEETELFEDAESVDILNSDSDGEGFLTDEEWDVLGLSDEEIV